MRRFVTRWAVTLLVFVAIALLFSAVGARLHVDANSLDDNFGFLEGVLMTSAYYAVRNAVQ